MDKTTPHIPHCDSNDILIPRVQPAITYKMNDDFITCSYEEVIGNYMPFAPSEGYVKQFMHARMALGSTMFTRHEDDYRKTIFTNHELPPNLRDKEGIFYANLERVAREIETFGAPPGRKRNNFSYHNCPDDNVASDILGKFNRIEACFRSGQGQLRVHDIAVTIEQTQNIDSLQWDNDVQVASMNVKIMNEDIRRMFIWGISIEEDQFCVFYHSRSHSVISEPLCFVKEPWKLVQVFMAFMFATEAELGYDPMVNRNSDGVYTYEIPSEQGSRFFRADKSLSSYCPNNITGRSLNVWSVTEVDATGDPLNSGSTSVLKDVWLEEDAKTEKEIQQDIFGDIEKFFKSDNPEIHEFLENLRNTHAELVESGRYKDYFLTIMTDYVGQVSKPVALNSGRGDSTLISRPSTPAAKADRIFVSTPDSERPHRGFVPRKQYRVVFEEECTALRDLRTLGEMVDALTSAITALELLLGAGWVHRDISCSNLLVQYCEHGSQIKLADLEYAKRFPPAAGTVGSMDPKIGTAYYMPTEILQQAYIYKPHDDAMYRSLASRRMMPSFDFEAMISTRNDETSTITHTLPEPILHNFQHDLESLWWILLRVLTDFIPNPVANAWARQLFDNSIGQTSGPRFDAFHFGVTKLRTVLPPHLPSTFASVMEYLREELRKNYIACQKLGDIYCQSSYVPVHALFRDALTILSSHRREEWAPTSFG